MLLFLILSHITSINVECEDLKSLLPIQNFLKDSSKGYYEIEDCFFQRSTTYIGQGSVISIYNKEVHLQINLCSFFECTSTASGGAIYFYAYDSTWTYCSFSIYKTCASKCFVKTLNNNWGSGQFFFVGPQGATNLNVIEISIYHCCPNDFNNNSRIQSPIYIREGREKIQFLNISYNNLYSNSAIDLYNPFNLQFSYSSFYKNNATYGSCIYLKSGSTGSDDTRMFMYCNIVDNSCGKDAIVELYSFAKYTFYECFFQNNNGCLYSVCKYSSLNLFYCRIYHFGTARTGSGQINPTELIFSDSEIPKYSNYLTNNCIF